MSTLFKYVPWNVQSLVDSVESGSVQLPDLQRPFVWSNAKIRDLLDSMYRGYPVGEIMFWNMNIGDEARTIGRAHGRQAAHQIIDGQQRLTSLFAVFKGAPVRDSNYNTRNIAISFNPFTEKFEVLNSAIQRSSHWIANVSEYFVDPIGAQSDFIDRLEETNDPLDREAQRKLSTTLRRLDNLRNYGFNVVEIQSDADKKQVADIFVRINSEGVSLKASDFILTWLSVFWPEGREQLEEFARNSRLTPQRATELAGHPVDWTPTNNYLAVDAGQLVRVLVAVGQNRAKLGDAYNALQAKDRNTGFANAERQDGELAKLQTALPLVLKRLHWTEFIRCLAEAGFKSRKMITSDINILSSYALWIIGRNRFKVDLTKLRNLIARWLFMSQLSGRYTGSGETQLQKDLDRLLAIENNRADAFSSVLELIIAAELSDDFWALRMPESLTSSSAALSPSYQTYLAALNILDADMFMLRSKVQQWMDPALPTTKGTEGHHLNPRKYLENVVGIKDLKKINQVANFAPTDWSTNILISDREPAEYWPALVSERGFSDDALRQQMFWHALPEDWETMGYDEFVQERRILMAQVTRAGYERLKSGQSVASPAIQVIAQPATHVGSDVADLVEAGILSPGDFLSPADDSIRMRAEVTEDGVVVIDGHDFSTLDAAAHHAGADNVPGAEFWQVEDNEGEPVAIQGLMDRVSQ